MKTLGIEIALDDEYDNILKKYQIEMFEQVKSCS